MQRTVGIIGATMLMLTAVGPAIAQIAPKGTGFRVEYLAELSVSEDHLVRLAEAIPAEKYTWRPLWRDTPASIRANSLPTLE